MSKSVAVLFALCLFLTACLPVLPPSQTSASPTSPVEEGGERDKWSLWTNGTQLRGANIWQRIRIPDLDYDALGEGHIGPPYEQSDFDRLAAAGANYVNLSIPGLFTERPPYVLDEGAQANLDSLLEKAQNAGLYAVIAFRAGPGRSDFTFYRDGAGVWYDPSLLVETLWSEQAAQDAWVEMWRYTAERYRDNPIVAGYDLMVEPNADDVMLQIYTPEEFYPRYAGTLYDWNQFYPRLVAAIREVDAETPILVEPMGWGSVPWLPYLEPVDAERIVYAAHQYGPFLYTHQQPDEDKPYPGEFDINWDGLPDQFDRAWLEAYLAPLEEYRQQTGAPVTVNEFGVVRWAPGAADFLRDEIAWFEAHGLNHAIWVWEPTYEPWYTLGDRAMYYPFGPDPANFTEVESDLWQVIRDSWARNTIRPPGGTSGAPNTPAPQPTAAPSPTPSPVPAPSYSLRFFGTGRGDVDRVKIPLLDENGRSLPVNVGETDFTIEFWLRFAAGENRRSTCAQGEDTWIYGNILFDRDIFGVPSYGDYGISLYGERIAFGVHNGSWGYTLCSSTRLEADTWYHVAVTRRMDGEMSLFINGNLDKRVQGPPGNLSYRPGRGVAWRNEPFLVIGAEKHDYDPGTYPSFRGWIDEARISTIVRYTENFPPPDSPFAPDEYTAALYHFDEGEGTVILDSSNAPGGPSHGERRVGGTSEGPVYDRLTPFSPEVP